LADVEALAGMDVGQIARRTRTVTACDIELFTELTGDRNPLHYDAPHAAASRFSASSGKAASPP